MDLFKLCVPFDHRLCITLTGREIVTKTEQFGTEIKFIDVPSFAVNNVILPSNELHEALAAVRTSNLATFAYLLLESRPEPTTGKVLPASANNLYEITEVFLKNVVPADNPKTDSILTMLADLKTQYYIISLGMGQTRNLDHLFKESLASHEGKVDSPDDAQIEANWKAKCEARQNEVSSGFWSA